MDNDMLNGEGQPRPHPGSSFDKGKDKQAGLDFQTLPLAFHDPNRS